ncbi:RNA-binding protein [Mycetocola zhadangensis]|nr:RNA-binding protein [Mycetocola zhadangensis]
MWEAYATAFPDSVRACPDYTIEAFGDSAELADALLGQVLHGSKRATSELTEAFLADGDPLPRVGSHWVVCDGAGRPRIIVRSTELRIETFDTVDAAFAFDEGEGDRSLESWRREHRRFWERTCAARGAIFSERDEIVLERFRVVWPPDLAD